MACSSGCLRVSFAIMGKLENGQQSAWEAATKAWTAST
jgi:hypothetical protein